MERILKVLSILWAVWGLATWHSPQVLVMLARQCDRLAECMRCRAWALDESRRTYRRAKAWYRQRVNE